MYHQTLGMDDGRTYLTFISVSFCVQLDDLPINGNRSTQGSIGVSSGTRRNESAGLAFLDAIRESMMFQDIPVLTFGPVNFENPRLGSRVADLCNQSLPWL